MISRKKSPGVLLGETESVFCNVLQGIGDTLFGPFSGEWAVEWPLSVAIRSLSGELSSWRSLEWHFRKTKCGRLELEPVAAFNSSARDDDDCIDVWPIGRAKKKQIFYKTNKFIQVIRIINKWLPSSRMNRYFKSCKFNMFNFHV